MRLWTLHPRYLDARGLVALWREALLAQAVLSGQTRGYTRHPQLIRFRESSSPAAAIASYLIAVHAEAARRGYCFDAAKIALAGCAEPVAPITATRGQLSYEWAHLRTKLCNRAPAWLAGIGPRRRPVTHPLFRIVPGPVAAWEVRPPEGVQKKDSEDCRSESTSRIAKSENAGLGRRPRLWIDTKEGG
jgi:hypothetical protein